MHALIPAGADDPDLHDWYGEHWVTTGGVRVNFIASVDGGITVAGRSAGLQTTGDNAVFGTLRDLADVVLVASGTAVAEGYRAVTLAGHRQQIRRERGFAPALPTAVVSRRLRLDPASALFAAATPANRTIVITCAAATADLRDGLARVAEVVVAGDDDVDLFTARRALEERGLTRILCEGGPSLFASLTAAGVVDELDLSVSPLLVGPDVARVVSGAAWAGPAVALRLHRLLAEDDALFARYLLLNNGRSSTIGS